jgi:hypothetical protein
MNVGMSFGLCEWLHVGRVESKENLFEEGTKGIKVLGLGAVP